jgi:tetratricopeptide (TPR) repeat protein
MLKPTGFWSYSSSDDEHSRGRLSQLRALLAAELQQKIGRSQKVNIFQDVAAIPPGQEWERQIRSALNSSFFLIPIITPGTLQSEWCCREINLFRGRETTLGRRDLIFPLHYLNVEYLDTSRSEDCYDQEVFAFIRTRQWIDFRSLRLKHPDSEEVALKIEVMADAICAALRRNEAAVPATANDMTSPRSTVRKESEKLNNQSDYDSVIADYDELIRLNPNDADVFYYGRGRAKEAKGDLDRAIADYDEAIRLNPEGANAYYNRGRAKEAKGDLDRAIVDYDEAIRLNPEGAKAYYNRGRAKEAKGDLDRAIADYDEAIRLNPKGANAAIDRVRYLRARAKEAEGDRAGGEADIVRARSIDPW